MNANLEVQFSKYYCCLQQPLLPFAHICLKALQSCCHLCDHLSWFDLKQRHISYLSFIPNSSFYLKVEMWRNLYSQSAASMPFDHFNHPESYVLFCSTIHKIALPLWCLHCCQKRKCWFHQLAFEVEMQIFICYLSSFVLAGL